jgi:hypothetical protein
MKIRKFYTNFGALASVAIYITLLTILSMQLDLMINDKAKGITSQASTVSASEFDYMDEDDKINGKAPFLIAF